MRVDEGEEKDRADISEPPGEDGNPSGKPECPSLPSAAT
jgi:hypothetical protein